MPPDSDFKAKMRKIRLTLGRCPRPRCGSLQCSPRPPGDLLLRGGRKRKRGRGGKRRGREKEGEGRGDEGKEWEGPAPQYFGLEPALRSASFQQEI